MPKRSRHKNQKGDLPWAPEDWPTRTEADVGDDAEWKRSFDEAREARLNADSDDPEAWSQGDGERFWDAMLSGGSRGRRD